MGPFAGFFIQSESRGDSESISFPREEFLGAPGGSASSALSQRETPVPNPSPQGILALDPKRPYHPDAQTPRCFSLSCLRQLCSQRVPSARISGFALRTRSFGVEVGASRIRRTPRRRRQRLSWQCKNCTEALKTGRSRKLKRAGRVASECDGGEKATEASAGQPPLSSTRAGPEAGREDGVTEQRCRARPQRGEGRARAA